MNENIDLRKILKDCPKGTMLYSLIHGYVKFSQILDKGSRVIEVISTTKSGKRYTEHYTFRGQLHSVYNNSECILFPSKDQRDWSKFTAPWLKKERDTITLLEKQGKNSADKIEPIFKVGEWVVNKFDDSWHIDSLDKKNYQVSDGKGNYNYFPIPKQDEMRLWNILDAKDGDVLCYRDDIILFKSYFVLQGSISMYCWYNRNTNNFYGKEIIYILSTKHKIYPATKEQRDAMMKAMNDARYE